MNGTLQQNIEAAQGMVWVAENAPNYLPDGWADKIKGAFERFKADGNKVLFVAEIELVCSAWGPLVSSPEDEGCNNPVEVLCGPEMESRRRSAVLEKNAYVIEATYLEFVAPFDFLPAARG